MFRKIAVIACGVLVLSGCTLGPPSVSNNNGGTFGASSAVSGSLWKTSDGGKTFEVKSSVDEKTTITKADILSIAYHPTQSGTIYVGSVDNGIFKTENSGDTWTPIAFPPKRIYSFLIDRNNPDQHMFASGVVNNWGKIFQTNNGGQTWEEVYTEPGQQTTVTALAQHPQDMNVLFAGTSAGTVIKSTDGGVTWKNIGNKIQGTVADIAFDATQKMTVYLMTYTQKIYYSSDGGVTWVDWEEEKPKELSDLQSKASKLSSSGHEKEAQNLQNQIQSLSERNQKNKMPSNIVSLAVDPARSGVLYAGTMATGLYVSTDYGKYWTEVNIIESAKQFPIRSIAVNPKDSKEIVFVSAKAFYKSIDEGATWSTTGLNVDRSTSFVSYDPFDSHYLFVGLRKF